MRIVLHIGPHKTGTTYIQRQFMTHRDMLAKHGWLYPEVGRPEQHAGHHDLAHKPDTYVMTDGTDEKNALRGLSASKSNIIFSAEGLCMWRNGVFEKFIDTVRADTIDLVYFVRDPYDVLYSFWKEEVKQGFTDSLPEKFMKQFSDPAKSRLLNPMLDLHRYRKLGNKFRLLLLPYDALTRANKDIFDVLINRVLGVDAKFPNEIGMPNNALPIETTEFLRYLTEDFQIGSGTRDKSVRFALYKLGIRNVIARVDAAFSLEAKALIKKLKLERDARQFLAVERNIIEKHKDCFLEFPADGKLFSKEPARIQYYDKYDVMTSKPVLDLYREIRAEIEEKLKHDSSVPSAVA